MALRHQRPIRKRIARSIGRATAWMMDSYCSRKKAYKTKNQAKLAASRSSKKTGELIEPYKCGLGGHWHIGHPPRGTVVKL